MRLALWLLALFGVAVALALLVGNNSATVTLFWPPQRIDVSLNLVLLCLLLLQVLLYLAGRALSALLALPGQALRWRLQHRERNMHAALLEALAHLQAGRFIRARKAALQAQQQHLLLGAAVLGRRDAGSGFAVLAHLLAAEAAHALQDRSGRQQQLAQAQSALTQDDPREWGEALQLRAARWALDDRDPAAASEWLDALSHGAARRTLALRLRLEAARLARKPALALETARLLAKHRAFSPDAAASIVRSLALDSLADAYDPQQLQRAWAQLEPREQQMPEVAVAAAQRLLELHGSVAESQQWLLPVWERLAAADASLSDSQRLQLLQALQAGFALTDSDADAAWLTRIEAASERWPADASLHYLAGVVCLQHQLWGKAQQYLTWALPGLAEPELRRCAWQALAALAEQRGDAEAAAQAYRQLAQS